METSQNSISTLILKESPISASSTVSMQIQFFHILKKLLILSLAKLKSNPIFVMKFVVKKRRNKKSQPQEQRILAPKSLLPFGNPAIFLHKSASKRIIPVHPCMVKRILILTVMDEKAYKLF